MQMQVVSFLRYVKIISIFLININIIYCFELRSQSQLHISKMLPATATATTTNNNIPVSCRNCVYFKQVDSKFFDSYWMMSKCKKFKNYTDLCRKSEELCGLSGKSFIHKNTISELHDFFTYADLLFQSKNNSKIIRFDNSLDDSKLFQPFNPSDLNI